MTKEEIVRTISDDKMMPFIQTGQLVEIVDFVIKNYKPSLPSNLDEAAEEYAENILASGEDMFDAIADGFKAGAEWMASREKQEQPDNMIQWTGNNLKEVIDFTGKSPRFGEWFKSWEEYENHVHTHNDILKLFCEDGSHYEVPVGAWIVKTPDGYNLPSIAKYIQQEQPEVDLEKEIIRYQREDMDRDTTVGDVARHFYKLGLNARKEE